MSMRVPFVLCIATLTSQAIGQDLPVIGGETSVLLGGTTEEQNNLTAAGVSVTGIGGDTFESPTLDGGVAFPIDPASTFMFTEDSLFPVSGTIGHSGTVDISTGLGAFSPGDFSIEFDDSRPGTNGFGSGFYVRDTVGGLGIMFDLDNPAPIVPLGPEGFRVTGDLVVSPELANALGDANLAGADVGDAFVNAQVPEPATLTLVAGLALAAAAFVRRKR